MIELHIIDARTVEGFVVEWETRTSHFIYWFRTEFCRKLIKDKNKSVAEPLWLRCPEILGTAAWNDAAVLRYFSLS